MKTPRLRLFAILACGGALAAPATVWFGGALPARAQTQPDETDTGERAKSDKPEKPVPVATSLPNDKKLIALHNEFVKKAEKLANEFEHSRQADKAALVYEQILKLMPDNEKAQQQLDRLRQREAVSGHKTFEVQANKDWQDTGVRVIAGKPLKLSARGEWTFNMSYKLGPDGMEIPKALRDFHLGSLIGIIADPATKNPKPFYIGPSKDFVADQSGPLLVRMHDTDPSDNHGTLTLEIVGRFDSK